MTANDLKQRMLRILGYTTTGTAPDAAVDDVTQAVNQAYQILWFNVPINQRTHYTRRIDQISLTAGTNSYQLAEDVQSVLPPVRLTQDDRTVLPASHKSEVINYGFVTGRTVSDTSNNRPETYYTERVAQNQDDGTRIRLLLAPTPATAETLDVEVEISAPEFSAADFCSETPPSLRIPHDYAESLLFPVAAYLLAGRSTYFNQQEKLQTLQADYQRALASVGASDPLPTATKLSQTTGDN